MKKCPNCGKQYTPVLALDKMGMARWNSGMLIQEAWPHAKAIEREQLQTGICSDKCWDEFLGAEE